MHGSPENDPVDKESTELEGITLPLCDISQR